mmetsp:Transcript_104842/g.302481  ORF Transcript_104842/g.302481 Transcript_104842/m.302481 type:complete len:790 (+) Transcript_104842:726-3095(+)
MAKSIPQGAWQLSLGLLLGVVVGITFTRKRHQIEREDDEERDVPRDLRAPEVTRAGMRNSATFEDYEMDQSLRVGSHPNSGFDCPDNLAPIGVRAPSASDAMVGGYGGGSSRAPTPTRRDRSGSNDVSDAATLNKKLRNASNGTLSEAEKEEVVSKIRPSTSLGFGNLTSSEKYVLAMVGLPARGKSYIVKMIIRYLQWTGVQARLFNVGNFRRQKGLGAVNASFFDTNNKNAIKERENLAMAVMEEMIEWLCRVDDVAVGIFDATNTTIKRRERILERGKKSGVKILFIESICSDPDILSRNYRMKLSNDDYKGQEPEVALRDFIQRVKKYEKVYEEVEDTEDNGNVSYIKLINVGQKITTRLCAGYLPSQVAFYLTNIHISPRKIWLTRHAESRNQIRGLLGRDSGEMTKHGETYARELATFITAQIEKFRETVRESRLDLSPLAEAAEAEAACQTPDSQSRRRQFGENVDERIRSSSEGSIPVPDLKAKLGNKRGTAIDGYEGDRLVVLIGTQAIHQSTVKYMQNIKGADVEIISTSLLNELRGGELDGMTYSDIQNKYPDIWNERMKDKLHFRYPGAGGESYIDVIQRVKPIIIELERQRKSILVVSHLAVQRCLYAYFVGAEMEQVPYLDLPIHSVTELSIQPHGTTERHMSLARCTPLLPEVKQMKGESDASDAHDIDHDNQIADHSKAHLSRSQMPIPNGNRSISAPPDTDSARGRGGDLNDGYGFGNGVTSGERRINNPRVICSKVTKSPYCAICHPPRAIHHPPPTTDHQVTSSRTFQKR